MELASLSPFPTLELASLSPFPTLELASLSPFPTLELASLSPFLYNPLLRNGPNPTATLWLVSLSLSLSHPLQLFKEYSHIPPPLHWGSLRFLTSSESAPQIFFSSLHPSVAAIIEPKISYRWAGCYSETGFHIGMDRNFVCLWRRHNCNWSLPFCADLLIYEINYWVFKQFSFTCNNIHIINN